MSNDPVLCPLTLNFYETDVAISEMTAAAVVLNMFVNSRQEL